MKIPEELRTVCLDIQTGELHINGELVTDVFDFALEFQEGLWQLELQQKKSYKFNGKAASKDTDKVGKLYEAFSRNRQQTTFN